MPDSELRAFDALAAHARLSDLVAIVRAIATSAAEGRTAPWTNPTKVRALAEEAKLTLDDAATPFGNALAVLERGPEDDAERALARALWAHAIAETPPKGPRRRTESRRTSCGSRRTPPSTRCPSSIARSATPRPSCGRRSRIAFAGSTRGSCRRSVAGRRSSPARRWRSRRPRGPQARREARDRAEGPGDGPHPPGRARPLLRSRRSRGSWE